MNTLQKALLVNAIFSTVSGLNLVIFHHSIAKLFKVNSTIVFWVVGIGLIFFAFTILLEIKKQRAQAIKMIIIQDYIWVIASTILLIFRPFNISIAGNLTIAIIAIIVLVMAVSQSKALAQTKVVKEKAI